jgi:hypothetical protein
MDLLAVSGDNITELVLQLGFTQEPLGATDKSSFERETHGTRIDTTDVHTRHDYVDLHTSNDSTMELHTSHDSIESHTNHDSIESHTSHDSSIESHTSHDYTEVHTRYDDTQSSPTAFKIRHGNKKLREHIRNLHLGNKIHEQARPRRAAAPPGDQDTVSDYSPSNTESHIHKTNSKPSTILIPSSEDEELTVNISASANDLELTTISPKNYAKKYLMSEKLLKIAHIMHYISIAILGIFVLQVRCHLLYTYFGICTLGPTEPTNTVTLYCWRWK